MGKAARAIATEQLSESISIHVGAKGRDEVSLRLEIRAAEVISAELTAIGCTEMLIHVQMLRPELRGPLAELPLPAGDGHAAMLLREAILKAQGKWDFPYKDGQICHCRAVPTAKVDAAILAGCRSVHAVKRATSASTSCGTCRPDVERVLDYRLRLPR